MQNSSAICTTYIREEKNTKEDPAPVEGHQLLAIMFLANKEIHKGDILVSLGRWDVSSFDG